METPSVVAAIRAYPRWTVALLVAVAALGVLQAMVEPAEQRSGPVEVASLALGMVFIGVAAKVMVMQMLRVRRAGQFSPGEWRHVGAILLIMIVSLIVSAPFLTSVLPHVELSDIPAKADWLDGGLVEVEGVVQMDEQSRRVVSSPGAKGQACVALLVTDDEFQSLKKFHLRRSFVAGTFEKAGCAASSNCDISCGPYAIVRPTINSADKPDEQ